MAHDVSVAESASPALSGRASPNPRAGRQVEEGNCFLTIKHTEPTTDLVQTSYKRAIRISGGMQQVSRKRSPPLRLHTETGPTILPS